jgi:uroporphyrinogen decarboxylase
MNRRKFVWSGALAMGGLSSMPGTLSAFGSISRNVDKREMMHQLINENKPQEYYPGGFFIHFGNDYKIGTAAVNKHLEYFRYTNMDFMKIQYEKTFPKNQKIQKPSDWINMPLHKKDFYREPLAVIKGIVKEARKEAPVIATFYSPYACAGHTTSDKILTQHLEEDPGKVKKGLEIITESLMIYVKECVKLGVDGFLQSTQGGEGGRFSDYSIFTNYIKPFDLIVGKEMEKHCWCNVLHICDYLADYDDYSAFTDYPGHLINASLRLTNGNNLTTKEMYRQFQRPFMGGMNRLGIMATGPREKIVSEVRQVISKAPEKFVLAASCTLPGDTDWANIRTALETAHTID